MRRFLAILVSLCAVFTAVAQMENSIIIDHKSFRSVQSDALTGVAVDAIGVDDSRRPCARIKVKINRMTREDIDNIAVKIITNNQLTKCKTAAYENGLILEMTAKPETRFYFNHPLYGESNEVNLALEPNKEYYIAAYLNQQLSITVISDVVGADIYLDDIFVGQTNANRMLTVHNVTPEKHVLRVEYSGRCVAKAISVNSDNLAFMQDILSVEQSIKREPQMAKVKPESETAKNYRIGDIVTVNGVKGIVFQISPVVKVVSVSEITAQWSTENFITGATNVDDGSVNMTKIKAIYGWESKYPAFKWCADLGDGWYLPSYNEVKAIYNQKNALNSTVLADGLLKFSAGYYWSSTECNDGSAYLANFSSGIVDCYYKFYNFKQVRAICVL